MAPKTVKRQAALSPATKESGKRAKRSASGNSNGCDLVAKTLRSVAGEPQDVLAMIATMLPSCLELCKDQRHDFQHQVIGMAEKALAKAEAGMEAAVKEGEAHVAAAPEEKARCEAATAEAEAALEAAKGQARQYKVALSVRTAAVKVAQAGVKEAQAARKEGDAELDAAARNKGHLEGLVAEQVASLKSNGGSKTAVGSVVKALKEASLENSLLDALAATLHRSPAQRGAFDQVVLEQLDGAVAHRLAQLEDVLATGAAAKEERAAAMAAAQAARDEAKAAQEAASAANEEALAALTLAETSFEEAREALESFDRKQAEAEAELESAKERLAHFRNVALATFFELRDKATPPAELGERTEPTAQPDAEAAPAGEAPSEELPTRGTETEEHKAAVEVPAAADMAPAQETPTHVTEEHQAADMVPSEETPTHSTEEHKAAVDEPMSAAVA